VTDVVEELVSGNLTPMTIPGIATIDPSFSITASPDGFVQNQPNFHTVVGVDFQINNLQFIYPTNSSPATVDVSTPSVPISVSISPNENALAQFGLSLVPQLNVAMTVFGIPGEAFVSYNLGFSVTMNATPGSGNNVNACTNIDNSVILVVNSNGSFFSALRAEDIVLFQDANTLLSLCEEAELGPSPSLTHRSRSPFYERDLVDCPAAAATPLNAISFTVMST